MCVHDYLAMRMCGEMLKDPTAPEVRLYAKTLSNLELSRDDTVRKDLHTLLQQLVQVYTVRVCACLDPLVNLVCLVSFHSNQNATI